MKTLFAWSVVVAALGIATVAAAQDDQEAVSRYCNKIYRKLCHDIKAGPEMIGQCAQKHPDVGERIPTKCTEDFQTNVENYNDAKGQQ